MKFQCLLVSLLYLAAASAFCSPPRTATAFRPRPTQELYSTQQDDAVESKLDEIAIKLRLRVFDVNTGVYGFESKDNAFGLENIHTAINVDHNGWLGLELTEVAHSNVDHRGLVLVSKVEGHALHETPIHVGDVVIGVFAGDDFKESVTGFDYDDTVKVIQRAKKHSLDHGGHGVVSLELNRLVKKATVHLTVEDDNGKVAQLDALAGDNLRLFLMHHHTRLYDEGMHRMDQPAITGNCGGEGICGTCLVAVQEGMNHLNKVGPQEQSILTNRPASWRAACKTVLGADNQEADIRIRVHPQTSVNVNDVLRP